MLTHQEVGENHRSEEKEHDKHDEGDLGEVHGETIVVSEWSDDGIHKIKVSQRHREDVENGQLRRLESAEHRRHLYRVTSIQVHFVDVLVSWEALC